MAISMDTGANVVSVVLGSVFLSSGIQDYQYMEIVKEDGCRKRCTLVMSCLMQRALGYSAGDARNSSLHPYDDVAGIGDPGTTLPVW